MVQTEVGQGSKLAIGTSLENVGSAASEILKSGLNGIQNINSKESCVENSQSISDKNSRGADVTEFSKDETLDSSSPEENKIINKSNFKLNQDGYLAGRKRLRRRVAQGVGENNEEDSNNQSGRRRSSRNTSTVNYSDTIIHTDYDLYKLKSSNRKARSQDVFVNDCETEVPNPRRSSRRVASINYSEPILQEFMETETESDTSHKQKLRRKSSSARFKRSKESSEEDSYNDDTEEDPNIRRSSRRKPKINYAPQAFDEIYRLHRKRRRESVEDTESEVEEQSENSEDPTPPLRIELILAKESRSIRDWIKACSKMNSHYIDEGSMLIYEQDKPKYEECDMSREETRYLIKWRDYSYLHVSWEIYDNLKRIEFFPQQLKKFEMKQFELSYLYDDEYFNPDFIQIDRILEINEYDDNKDFDESQSLPEIKDTCSKQDIIDKKKKGINVEYYIKWRSLPYDCSTWEQAIDIHDEQAVIRYYKFIHKPKSISLKSRPIRKATNFRAYSASKPPKFPKGFHLREYQLTGLNWLLFNWYNNRNSILADEMGLGKTLQTVSCINHLVTEQQLRGPYLVVAPLSTLPHWQREFSTWTNLNAIIYHGNIESRNLIRQYEFFFEEKKKKEKKKEKKKYKFHVLITSPQLCLNTIESFTGIQWQMLVVDEAHRLKNRSSKLSDQLKKLWFRDCLLLTGTPLQNNLEELWALLNFVDPDRFEDVESFLAKYGELKESNQVDSLHKELRPYILRRMKEDVEKSIAPKEEILIEVELTVLQKKYYRAIYEKNTQFLTRAGRSNTPSLLNIMMELRKCCNHPFLIKGAEAFEVSQLSPKQTKAERQKAINDLLVSSCGKFILLDKLLPRLKENGHRVLIFSQFKIMLDIIQDYLVFRKFNMERIDGSITGDQRQSTIDRFTSPDSKSFVMLLSTRAGGVGINLTAADTVIIYDSDWNPQNDIQAQARCHRIGQDKAVKVYRLLASKTYEREMFRRASLKLGLDQAVLGGMKQKNSANDSLSKKEIEELLKHGAYQIFKEDKDGTSETTSKQFSEASIDQILSRSETIIHDKNVKNSIASSFSKASFVSSTTDTKGTDVSIDDPDFWTKVVGLETVPEVEEIPAKRRCRSTRKMYKEDSAESLNDEPFISIPSSGSSSDESIDGMLEVSKMTTNVSSSSYRLCNNHVFMYGYGQWDLIHTGSLNFWKRKDLIKYVQGFIAYCGYLHVVNRLQPLATGKIKDSVVENNILSLEEEKKLISTTEFKNMLRKVVDSFTVLQRVIQDHVNRVNSKDSKKVPSDNNNIEKKASQIQESTATPSPIDNKNQSNKKLLEKTPHCDAKTINSTTLQAESQETDMSVVKNSAMVNESRSIYGSSYQQHILLHDKDKTVPNVSSQTTIAENSNSDDTPLVAPDKSASESLSEKSVGIESNKKEKNDSIDGTTCKDQKTDTLSPKNTPINPELTNSKSGENIRHCNPKSKNESSATIEVIESIRLLDIPVNGELKKAVNQLGLRRTAFNKLHQFQTLFDIKTFVESIGSENFFTFCYCGGNIVPESKNKSNIKANVVSDEAFKKLTELKDINMFEPTLSWKAITDDGYLLLLIYHHGWIRSGTSLDRMKQDNRFKFSFSEWPRLAYLNRRVRLLVSKWIRHEIPRQTNKSESSTKQTLQAISKSTMSSKPATYTKQAIQPHIQSNAALGIETQAILLVMIYSHGIPYCRQKSDIYREWRHFLLIPELRELGIKRILIEVSNFRKELDVALAKNIPCTRWNMSLNQCIAFKQRINIFQHIRQDILTQPRMVLDAIFPYVHMDMLPFQFPHWWKVSSHDIGLLQGIEFYGFGEKVAYIWTLPIFPKTVAQAAKYNIFPTENWIEEAVPKIVMNTVKRLKLRDKTSISPSASRPSVGSSSSTASMSSKTSMALDTNRTKSISVQPPVISPPYTRQWTSLPIPAKQIPLKPPATTRIEVHAPPQARYYASHDAVSSRSSTSVVKTIPYSSSKVANPTAKQNSSRVQKARHLYQISVPRSIPAPSTALSNSKPMVRVVRQNHETSASQSFPRATTAVWNSKPIAGTNTQGKPSISTPPSSTSTTAAGSSKSPPKTRSSLPFQRPISAIASGQRNSPQLTFQRAVSSHTKSKRSIEFSGAKSVNRSSSESINKDQPIKADPPSSSLIDLTDDTEDSVDLTSKDKQAFEKGKNTDLMMKAPRRSSKRTAKDAAVAAILSTSMRW